MSSSCCTSGFSWHGHPQGRESKIFDHDVYIAGDDDDDEKKDVAILFLHDIFGWTFGNNRLLADHFACGGFVGWNFFLWLEGIGGGGIIYRWVSSWIPFGGEVITEEMIFDPEKFTNLDLQSYMQRNSKEARGPAVHDFARKLKTEMGFKKVGAVGYCWGGWAAFQLGGKGKNLVDAISVAHPTFLTKEEIDDVAVPVQILAPETDPRFTPELKEHANRVIPTLGVEYDYQYFPGLAHGFSCRADENDEKEKMRLERAKNAVNGWFGQMLQGR